MTKKEVLSFLQEHKKFFQERFQVKKIALFGSYARDDFDEKSDIDILVDMPSSFDNYYELKEFLEKELKRKIDLGLEDSLRTFIKNSITKEIIYV